jgi:hypothetical protein
MAEEMLSRPGFLADARNRAQTALEKDEACHCLIWIYCSLQGPETACPANAHFEADHTGALDADTVSCLLVRRR